MELINQPSGTTRLGDYLRNNLFAQWTQFRAAVAFVKRTGTRHIVEPLSSFARHADVEIIVGIDHAGTSQEGLQDLLTAVTPRGRITVVHNRLPFTFHPKLYMFKCPHSADVMIGSGNLTEGGLFTNYEAGVRLILDLDDRTQAAFLRSIEDVLDSWTDLASGVSRILSTALIERLVTNGLVLPEAVSYPTTGDFPGVLPPNVHHEDPTIEISERSVDLPFAAIGVPPAPKPPTATIGRSAPTRYVAQTSASRLPAHRILNFVMTLQRTDVWNRANLRGHVAPVARNLYTVSGARHGSHILGLAGVVYR